MTALELRVARMSIRLAHLERLWAFVPTAPLSMP